MNATVTYVPSRLVFPRSNKQAEFLGRTPPGSIAACHKAGWIQKECFTQWFKYSVRFVKPSKTGRVIPTLDGHYSDSTNIELIDCARKNGVHVVCLTPHGTHILQPLEFSFMGPLKEYYAQEIEM